MSLTTKEPRYTVAASIPTQDGNWMIRTTKGQAGSSPVPIPDGAAIVIRDGKAVRP